MYSIVYKEVYLIVYKEVYLIVYKEVHLIVYKEVYSIVYKEVYSIVTGWWSFRIDLYMYTCSCMWLYNNVTMDWTRISRTIIFIFIPIL